MRHIDDAPVSVLDQLTPLANSALVRFAPGYAYLEGLFRLIPLLSRAREVRLLIGNLTHQETLEQLAQRGHRLEPVHEASDARRYLTLPQTRQVAATTVTGFRECLEAMEQTKSNQDAGRLTLDLLERQRLQVRVHVHGSFGTRMYLFEGSADTESKQTGFLGSTNLLLPVALDPTDYLMRVGDEECRTGIVNHFDHLWDKARDVSDLLASEIRNSWIGQMASPYDIYMKTLYTLVRERVEFDPDEAMLDEDIIGRLADFQRSAFRQAIRIIQGYGGAFVSDVVGLGKSYIGAAVVKHFEQTEHARPLILCPAPLVEMWERYNEIHRLNAQVLSVGMLRKSEAGGNVLLDDFRFRDRDFVLLDESHAFRNPGTQRYTLLRDFLARGRRRICLLTATPRNRSAWDIYHQIKLFHQEDRTTLPINPPNLREFFRAVEKGQRELPELLSNLLIRRTRNHILRFYGYDAETKQRVDPAAFRPYLDGKRRAYVMIGEKPQFFPRRELTTIEYSIERTYQGLYEHIRAYLTPPPQAGSKDSVPTHLLFARYALWHYVEAEHQTIEPYVKLRATSAGLHGLIRVLLFKRFESSVEAFRCSVRRMILAHRVFLAALKGGVVPAGEDAEAILREVEDFEDEEAIEALRDSSSRYAIGHFDDARLIRDVDLDLRLLEQILALVEPITPERDEKLLVLRNRLAQSPLKEGKRLIFTQFTDTARYLYEHLRADSAPFACVELMSSRVGNKAAVIGRFAPRANPDLAEKDRDRDIATLVTTDVMAEGLNLQDCDKIVNYDLHWNPVRLIQRFGRIDRIGSEHERIHGFNFLPEAGLERNLGLRQTLRQRIREIHETIGEDSSILETGETINEQAMYAIYEANGEAVAKLEEETDSKSVQLAEAEEMLRHLREKDPDEYARIAALPDGIRSAKSAHASGLFAFSQAGAYRELVLLSETGQLVSSDLPRLLGLLQCSKETPCAEFSEKLAELIVHVQRRFQETTRQRRVEQNHLQSLTHSQRYILRELRDVYQATEDATVQARVELFEQAFRQPLPQAVVRELNRLRKNGLNGEPLMHALVVIYHTHSLRERTQMSLSEASARDLPRLVCSEAFTKHRQP